MYSSSTSECSWYPAREKSLLIRIRLLHHEVQVASHRDLLVSIMVKTSAQRVEKLYQGKTKVLEEFLLLRRLDHIPLSSIDYLATAVHLALCHCQISASLSAVSDRSVICCLCGFRTP